MPTQDDLRNAMNDVVRTTEPLSAAAVLHAGKRYRNRRRMVAGAGAAAAVLAVVAGIGALNLGRPGEGAADGPGVIAQLRQAAEPLQDGNYTFRRTGAYFRTDVADGVVALPGGYLVEHAGGLAVQRAGSEVFLRYAGPGKEQARAVRQYALEQVAPAKRAEVEAAFAPLLADGWVRADEKRLVAAADVDEQSSLDYVTQFPSAALPDITGATALINAVRTAERSGDVITGTLDGTEVDESLQLLGPVDAPMSANGAAMSYRAVLDDQGRLAELTVEPAKLASAPPTPEKPEQPLVITISQYGRSVAPAAPPATATLTDASYDLLARDVD